MKLTRLTGTFVTLCVLMALASCGTPNKMLVQNPQLEVPVDADGNPNGPTVVYNP